MWQFSRSESDVRSVVDYVSPSLYQSVLPWLNMLRMYQANGSRKEFEAIARRLGDDFNVQRISWQPDGEGDAHEGKSLEDFPHIMRELAALWGSTACLAYLHGLLEDKGRGARTGFPLAAFEEALLLTGIAETLQAEAPSGVSAVLPMRSRHRAMPGIFSGVNGEGRGGLAHGTDSIG